MSEKHQDNIERKFSNSSAKHSEENVVRVKN